MAITIDFLNQDNNVIPTTYNIGARSFIRTEIRLTATSPHHNQVINGEFRKNNILIGRFNRTNTGVFSQSWFGGSKQPIYVNDGDTISAIVTSPISQTKTITIQREGLDIIGEMSLAGAVEKSRLFIDDKDTIPSKVMREAIRTISTYTDVTYSDKPAINVRNIERYMLSEVDLPPVTINIFDDPTQLQNALDQLKPITQREIFDAWPRFSFTNSGNIQGYWENPAQATSGAKEWQWQENNQRVYMPVNQSFWSGFVSQKKYDRYDHDMITGSTDGDDDWNAIVIAHTFQNNINHLLMVTISPRNNSNTWPGAAYGSNLVAYRGGKLQLHSNPPIAWDPQTIVVPNVNDPIPGGGWSGKYRKVGVIRRGDDITIKVSNWNSETFNENLTFSINLNDDPQFAIFKGPHSYGYANMSQGASYYRDIIFDGGERMDTITYGPTGEVYVYVDPITGWVVEEGLSLVDIYGAPRTLVSAANGDRFLLDIDGSISKIN